MLSMSGVSSASTCTANVGMRRKRRSQRRTDHFSNDKRLQQVVHGGWVGPEATTARSCATPESAHDPLGLAGGAGRERGTRNSVHSGAGVRKGERAVSVYSAGVIADAIATVADLGSR